MRKEEGEGGVVGAVEVCEQMEGHSCHQVTAHHQKVTLEEEEHPHSHTDGDLEKQMPSWHIHVP